MAQISSSHFLFRNFFLLVFRKNCHPLFKYQSPCFHPSWSCKKRTNVIYSNAHSTTFMGTRIREEDASDGDDVLGARDARWCTYRQLKSWIWYVDKSTNVNIFIRCHALSHWHYTTDSPMSSRAWYAGHAAPKQKKFQIISVKIN